MTVRRIVAGTAASFLNTGVSIVSNLILVPMYLHYLGREQYGLWFVVLSFVSYLWFSNFGISQSVANLVAAANARHDYDGIRAIVATGFWLYLMIILIVGVLVAGALVFVPWCSFIKISAGLKDLVVPVLAISSVFFLLQMPLLVFRVTLRSLNMIYKEQLLGTLFIGVQFVSVLIALMSKIGIVSLAVIYGVVGLLSGIALFLYLRMIIPNLTVSRGLVDKNLARGMIRPGFYFLVIQLSGALICGTDNIIISAVLGAAAVAPYAVAFTILMRSSGVAAVITSNLLPAITSAHALDNKQDLRLIYTNALKICFGIGLLAVFLLVSIGPDLMIKWVGYSNYVGNPTFYIFVALIFIFIMLWPADSILLGTTKHIGYAKMAIFEGFINILLSVWWIHLWGVLGVALGTLVARMLTNGWFMLYRAKIITGVNIRQVLEEVLRPFVPPVLGVLLLFYGLAQMSFSGWDKIIANTAGVCIVFLSLFYFVSLDRQKRIEINKLIKGMMWVTQK